MEPSETTIETLRSIVNPKSTQADDECRIMDFYQHLSKHTFRPLPQLMQTLPIIAALRRWPDLKSAVQQQLTDVLVTRWTAIEKSPTEKDINLDTSHEVPDPPSTLPIAANQKSAPRHEGQYLLGSVRRDWFDSLLDFVAALIIPTYAASK